MFGLPLTYRNMKQLRRMARHKGSKAELNMTAAQLITAIG